MRGAADLVDGAGFAVDGQRANRTRTTSSGTDWLESGDRALYVGGDLVRARAAFGLAFEQAERDRDPHAMARAALGLGGLWVHERRSAVDAARVGGPAAAGPVAA